MVTFAWAFVRLVTFNQQVTSAFTTFGRGNVHCQFIAVQADFQPSRVSCLFAASIGAMGALRFPKESPPAGGEMGRGGASASFSAWRMSLFSTLRVTRRSLPFFNVIDD